MIKNIMSVDLEDYFCDLPFDTWKNYESRIISTTSVLLDLFKKYNVSATFFCLGYIAEQFPELIEEIIKDGHEIASHGYSHIDIRKMSPEHFESDLVRSINILENISGEKVLGFRAPFFSIDNQNFWALKILKNHLKYDSSIFPVKTPLYGNPTAPRYPYRISEKIPLTDDPDSTFLEIPPATLHLPVIHNIPIAGGFYMRFLPLSLLKLGIKKMNQSKQPAMCYIHPKDLDSNMPCIPEYSWYYYWGLKNAAKKFESLLKNFHFSSVRDVMFLK